MTVEENIVKINNMSREQMCRLWLKAPSSHPYFKSGSPEWKAFENRFDKLGRFTPEISKRIMREND